MVENTIELRFPKRFWAQAAGLSDGHAFTICKMPAGVVFVSLDKDAVKFSYPFGKELVTSYAADGTLEFCMRDTPPPTLSFSVSDRHAP